MPINNPVEGEDAVENDTDFDNQLTGISRQRVQLSRFPIKESTEIEFQPDTEVLEKCAKLISNQRSSNRLNKRLRQEANPIDALKKPAAVKSSSTVGSKTRRPWELWSVEDKNAFFEALCEYGKDFESIQSYIAQRSKKKGVSSNMIKNKDQVRHFYYRTWHKISKFLEISVRKQTQELYGLINYAELRKKIGGCLNEKNRQKLNELVFSGVTTVKHKGKKLRIKTPVCRALKKINNVTDSKEPEVEKLPKDVVVEFRPHNNAAWLQVQNLSQNPRVRTKVCLQKRLKPVIEYLQRRWRSYRLKRKEQILTSLPNSTLEETTCDNQFVLRVKPPRAAKISPLSLSAMDIASSSDVCLENFMKHSQTVDKDSTTTKKICRLKQKILHDKQNDFNEAVSDVVDTSLDLCGECPDVNNSSETVDLNQNSGKCVADEISYINVLTPPKSVPECSDS
ncbi:protein cramped-like [Uloborus diversus]|uniref:protein cramped-like n=1 Tax=Uloborus diversus TaxID=327109 RepID=UPI0024097DE6|nr:protein cramped-like [Uloborus diversus]